MYHHVKLSCDVTDDEITSFSLECEALVQTDTAVVLTIQ